jgi:hypothetical protein
MRKKLQRAPKVGGVPVTMATAKSLSRAAADMLMNKRATLTERERRYNICLKCPERNHDRCTLCGCFVKTKTILKNSKCPVGKWSTLVSESSVNDTGTAESDE